MKLSTFGATVALIATAATSANAALTVYTNRAAFQAALQGGFTTETFNSVVGEPSFRTAPLTVGSITLLGSGTGQSDRNFIDQLPMQFPAYNIDGTTVVNGFLRETSSLSLGFANAVDGFGADFSDIQSSSTLSRIQVGNDVYTPTQATGIRFLGFIADAPFSSVNFFGLQTVQSGVGDGFSMDNVTFGSLTAVPEPETWAIMLFGLGCVGWAARRHAAH